MQTTSTSKILRTAAVAFFIPVIIVIALVEPSHKPKPHAMPIALSGPPAAAQAVLRPLGDVHIVRVSDPAAARHAVRVRSAYGAILAESHPSVEIASGESFVAATLLKQAALQAGIPPAHIVDVAPLPSGDPRGTALNLTVLALLIGSIIGATLLLAAAPTLAPHWREAILLAVATGAVQALPGSSRRSPPCPVRSYPRWV